MTPARPALWGVLNVTPDSFSDGGTFLNPQVALEHAHQMVAEGASVIDVGGESTRPGAQRVSAEEEQERVVGIVRELSAAGITVSIDTMRSETARLALDAGAAIVNDVSGGLADEAMVPLIAQSDCDYVMMHWRVHSESMDEAAVYESEEHTSELQSRLCISYDVFCFRITSIIRGIHSNSVTILDLIRSEQHTSELQSRFLISYAVFLL
mgnify:CR=1 FL=1